MKCIIRLQALSLLILIYFGIPALWNRKKVDNDSSREQYPLNFVSSLEINTL